MQAEEMKRIKDKAHKETPFYVFDLDVLQERIKMLRIRKASNSRLCYAMKANPFLIGPIEPLVDCFEVCSPGELSICRNLGIAPEKIVFSGVNKRKEEIADAIHYGVGVVTLESMQQYRYVKECADELQENVRIMPRLTGGGQFGMEKEALGQVLADSRENERLKVAGIHYFTGTQKKKTEKILEEARFLLEYCEKLKEEQGFCAPVLEFGTGMAVPYFEGDDFEGDLAPFEKLSEFLKTEGSQYQWTLEFGRYLAASCGYYFTRVVDQKTNHGIPYALVDGGIHHLNYYGQNMAMRIPQIVHLKEGRSEFVSSTQEWCICGSLCTFADVLVRKAAFTDLNVDDVLVFQNAGAYSVTEAIHLLLSRRMPGIYFYSQKDGLCQVRGRVETYFLNSVEGTRDKNDVE